jgi:hypothetical protein
MAVRARGSTGWITASSSGILPELRFEFDRKRFAVLFVPVRCIFRLDDATLLRCRIEACTDAISHRSKPRLDYSLLAACVACRH